jgi:hypothetical protein
MIGRCRRRRWRRVGPRRSRRLGPRRLRRLRRRRGRSRRRRRGRWPRQRRCRGRDGPEWRRCRWQRWGCLRSLGSGRTTRRRRRRDRTGRARCGRGRVRRHGRRRGGRRRRRARVDRGDRGDDLGRHRGGRAALGEERRRESGGRDQHDQGRQQPDRDCRDGGVSGHVPPRSPADGNQLRSRRWRATSLPTAASPVQSGARDE